METLAERLKWARKKKGWSQRELAEKAKVSGSTIGNLEAGGRKVPRELLAIAQVLEVDPLWLKEGKAPPPAIQPPEPGRSAAEHWQSTAREIADVAAATRYKMTLPAWIRVIDFMAANTAPKEPAARSEYVRRLLEMVSQ